MHAYSTLGYFNDHILSSFFYYNEHQLAEMIFHELFHTIFFVKNEVDLNENLAQYFAQQLTMEFFKDKSQKLALQRAQRKAMRKKNRLTFSALPTPAQGKTSLVKKGG